MKIKEGGVMDIEKLKAEFEKLECISEKLEYLNFDEHLDCYVEKSVGMPVGLAAWVNGALYGFQQAAKAQAVPEGFVLVSKEPTSEVLKAISAEIIKPNNGRIFLAKVYKAMIEAQEPAND